MTNKRLLLLIGGLALVTFFIMYFFNTPMMYRFDPMGGFSQKSEMMDYGAGSAGSLGMMPDIARDSMMYPPYYGDDALTVEDRVYLYSSSHDVIVRNVPEYLQQMRDYITSVEGKVLSYNTSSSEKFQSGYIYAQVPIDRFNEVNNRVGDGVKDVFREDITSQDVTGTVVNRDETVERLTEQLEARRAELAALEVGTPEYSRVQSQIQSLERQLTQARDAQEAIDEKVQYASVSIGAADSKRYFDPRGPVDPLTQFWDAVDSLGDSARSLLNLVIWVAVYSVLWLPIVLAARWIWRRFNRPKTPLV